MRLVDLKEAVDAIIEQLPEAGDRTLVAYDPDYHELREVHGFDITMTTAVVSTESLAEYEDRTGDALEEVKNEKWVPLWATSPGVKPDV